MAVVGRVRKAFASNWFRRSDLPLNILDPAGKEGPLPHHHLPIAFMFHGHVHAQLHTRPHIQLPMTFITVNSKLGHTFWCFHCTDLVLIDLDLTFDYFNKMYDYLNKTHRKQMFRTLQGKMVVEILCLGEKVLNIFGGPYT